MQKLGFPSLKGLENLRPLGASLGGARTAQISPRPSSDSISYGSFANLKLTAEKLVKEQASVKTDLDLAHTKLKKGTEQIHVLEAKLQEAVNENAKLKVKQTEDAKLWKGLDSKLSSTKTLCDQLTETLQHLAGQARGAEEDKKFFEKKLSDNSKALDDFNRQLKELCAKLNCAEDMIQIGKQNIMELKQEKEELERRFGDERSATENVIEGKDAAIRKLEDDIKENTVHLKTLDSQLQEAQNELLLKEEICKCLRVTQENLEKERTTLQCSNQDFSQKAEQSCQKIKEFEDLIFCLMGKINELDKESATVSDNIVKLSSLFETSYELAQQEKVLVIKSAQCKYEQLHSQFLSVRSENDAFMSEINESKNKIMELQKAQEFSMVQHAEECRLAEDKIRKLESEAGSLHSEKNESEKLLTELREKVEHFSEASKLTNNQMQDLLEKLSRLELEKQGLQDKMQLVLQDKNEETEKLQNEIDKHVQRVVSLEDQTSKLQEVLEEKEQLHLNSLERQKQLEVQKSEVQASLATAESNLIEARKQYDVMLDGKQIELSKHLKELSQRNDQAINVIRKKYESEKLDIANAEKEKAGNLIKEMERKCDEKIMESKEEALQYLMRVKEEHGAMISRMKQDHDEKELSIRARQKEELQRLEIHAETEMREKVSSLRKEHEIQIKSLKLQHEDDCKKLQEELDLQRSKEEKQKTLLQLQWKVMSENQQNDEESNTKKDFSVTSIKKRDFYNGKDHQPALTSPDNRKDANMSGLMHTPMASLMKKSEKRNRGNVPSIPKHSKKVTRHEYEVETSNGRTITKRRKTKSTMLFDEPNTQKRLHTKTPDGSIIVSKARKVNEGPKPHPANIGDLFSEGSLNPYNDDPYAFD